MSFFFHFLIIFYTLKSSDDRARGTKAATPYKNKTDHLKLAGEFLERLGF